MHTRQLITNFTQIIFQKKKMVLLMLRSGFFLSRWLIIPDDFVCVCRSRSLDPLDENMVNDISTAFLLCQSFFLNVLMKIARFKCVRTTSFSAWMMKHQTHFYVCRTQFYGSPYRASPIKKAQNRIIHVRISICFSFFLRGFVLALLFFCRRASGVLVGYNMYFYCEMRHENKRWMVGIVQPYEM